MDCFGRASLAMTYPTLPTSTTHRHGLGAWAAAKNRGSASLKAELSGLRLRAGRGALAERLPSARRHSPP